MTLQFLTHPFSIRIVSVWIFDSILHVFCSFWFFFRSISHSAPVWSGYSTLNRKIRLVAVYDASCVAWKVKNVLALDINLVDWINKRWTWQKKNDNEWWMVANGLLQYQLQNYAINEWTQGEKKRKIQNPWIIWIEIEHNLNYTIQL